MKKPLLCAMPALSALPAIALGAAAMHASGVSPSLYLQNVLCALLLSVLSFFLLKGRLSARAVPPLPVVLACAAALPLTFVHPGAQGVHRWVSLGPVSLYAASIVLPLLLIQLDRLIKAGRILPAASAAAAVCLLLALQPDAPMLTAFGAACALLLLRRMKTPVWILLAALWAVLAAATWLAPETLAAVDYVEGILHLICSRNVLWAALCITALAAMALPFWLHPPRASQRLARCLGVYVCLILLSAAWGCAPAPLLGYGMSPIIGHFIAMTWLAGAHLSEGDA